MPSAFSGIIKINKFLQWLRGWGRMGVSLVEFHGLSVSSSSFVCSKSDTAAVCPRLSERRRKKLNQNPCDQAFFCLRRGGGGVGERCR